MMVCCVVRLRRGSLVSLHGMLNYPSSIGREGSCGSGRSLHWTGEKEFLCGVTALASELVSC
jgi:hypothetical protein